MFNNQGRYAIINGNAALHVNKDSNDDGAIICPDEGQHQSSFLEIIPVGEGQWAGRACFFRTHAGKTFDIQGGQCVAGVDVKQWTFNGGPNQMWVITPADEKHSNPFQKGKGHGQHGQHGQHGNQPGQIIPPNKEVPHKIDIFPNVHYRIVSAARPRKALTVNSQGEPKCRLKAYNNDGFQRFKVMQENNKYAFVTAANNTALCVYKDEQFKDAHIVADAGQHQGSWFTIEPCHKGEWKNKGYLIKTFAINKVFDITGDYKDEPEVKQCSSHDAHNQMWLIVPADDPLPAKHQNQGQQGQQGQQGGKGQQMNIGGFKFNVPSPGELLKGFSGWGKHSQQQGGGGNHGNQGFGGGGNQGFGGGGNQGFQGGPFKQNQTYAILSEGNPKKCMHVIDHGMKMGNVAIHDWKGAMNQKFFLEPEGHNRYRLRSAANGNYVCVTHDNDGDTMWIRTDPKGQQKTQVWAIEAKNGNVFYVKSFFGKGIDVPACDYKNDNVLIQYSFHGNANQSWIIREA